MYFSLLTFMLAKMFHYYFYSDQRKLKGTISCKCIMWVSVCQSSKTVMPKVNKKQYWNCVKVLGIQVLDVNRLEYITFHKFINALLLTIFCSRISMMLFIPKCWHKYICSLFLFLTCFLLFSYLNFILF